MTIGAKRFALVLSGRCGLSTALTEFTPSGEIQDLRHKVKEWFMNLGFNEEESHRILVKYPRLEEVRLNQPVLKNVAFLSEKGMNSQGIVRFFDHVLTHYPQFLELDVKAEIEPIFAVLMDMGFREEEILIMTIRFPQFLSYDVQAIFPQRIQFLQELGLMHEDVKMILVRFPQIVEVSLENNIRPLTTYLHQELDVTAKDLQKILKKCPELLGVKLSAIRAKLEYLIELGFDFKAIRALMKRYPFFLRASLERDVQPILDLLLQYANKQTVHEMFYKCPQVLSKSYENDIHPKFQFFVELGYDPVDLRVLLEKFPEALCYSLEEEIMPAVEKSLEIGLSMMQTRITFARSPELFKQTIHKVRQDADKAQNK